MPTYTVTSRDQEGSAVAMVSVSSVDQDSQVIDDMTIVNAVRTAMANGNGVHSVVARKYDQVITIV
ncbi:hypothetical protein ACFWHW_03610 [Streptomyces pharetrae]|uniref:hypothetical protein n=1 Tax=Streptomyces pharetrae TaxID=291370 RepID=UPI00365AD006